jgi:hypothetical protein
MLRGARELDGVAVRSQLLGRRLSMVAIGLDHENGTSQRIAALDLVRPPVVGRRPDASAPTVDRMALDASGNG